MITIHWHLILYIIACVVIIYNAFTFEDDPFGFGIFFCLFIVVIITVIYGGIFWW